MRRRNLSALLLSTAVLLCSNSYAQTAEKFTEPTNKQEKNSLQSVKDKKMKIEIWSDVMCPFCYIGKKKFEKALAQFPHKDKVTVEWKSYQLMPELNSETGEDIEKILVEKKGLSLQQVKAMNAQVAQVGQQAGITFNFDKTLAVNTFNAHRFIHFAKKYGKQNEAEELLFKAYFTDGKNVNDQAFLLQLGGDLGLNTTDLKQSLTADDYASEVQKDIKEAQQIGVRGVPFFAFNRKYAVSGAQEPGAFLETLEKSFTEWQKENPEAIMETVEGKSCTPNEGCN